MHRGFDDGHPISMEWGTGSIGTRGGRNPSFRIMHLDAETLLPVKIDRHYMDSHLSNELGTAQWDFLYETAEEYGLKDLSPSSVFEFTESWSDDVEPLKKYLYNRDARYSKSSTDEVNCDDKCVLKNQCDWTTSETDEYKTCKGEKIVDWKGNVQNALYYTMVNPWMKKSWI